MINKKILGLLGLCARAGKITFGTDSTIDEIKKKKVKLVIVAEDSSNRTKEKLKKICETYNVYMMIYGNIEELSKSIGKINKAIIGVKDINLAIEIKRIYNGGEVIG